MRKLIVVFLSLVVLLTIAVYLIIPSTIKLEASKNVKISADALQRVLNDTSEIKNWWPKTDKIVNVNFYNGFSYKWTAAGLKTLELTVEKGSQKHTGELFVGSINADSSLLTIRTTSSSSLNPFKKVSYFLDASSLKQDFGAILGKINNYYSSDENTYGIILKRSTVTDSAFIATSGVSEEYPTVSFIYNLIDKLTAYVKSKDAIQTSPPMLNILRKSDGYLVRVALPVKKRLPDTKDFFYKWMPGGGNMLITDVRGGSHKTSTAMYQMGLYADDHKLTSPAIPYESLVTDRRQQPDSNQWLTRIYYPIMWFRN